MSKISKQIENIYSTVNEGEERRDIEPTYVEEAINALKKFIIDDTNGLFFFLSSINLLNAAIKMKKFKTDEYRKKDLKYFFIKGKARVVVEYVIAKRKFDFVDYFYNKSQRCLYIKVYDVVFSFHNIEETDFIKSDAANKPAFEWPGIKLQWIAEDVYLIAKSLIKQTQS